jgi:hypothetical protein
MKKIVGIILLSIVLFVGCSSKPASKEALGAAKKMLKSLTVLMVKTIGEMKKADSAVKSGEVLVAYAKDLKKLTVRAEALKKKFPDFDTAAKDGSLTSEAKVLQNKVSDLNNLYTEAEKKYKEDKVFIKSMQEMKKIMDSADKETVSTKTNAAAAVKKTVEKKAVK